jgi:ligand-binding sensor domain-containing protein
MIGIDDVTSQNPEWINYSSSNWVGSITEEGPFLWIASRSGLFKMDRRSREKEKFTSATGLPGGQTEVIAIDSNGIKWIGNSYGLAKFDGVNWEYFNTRNSPLLTDYITALLVDENNVLWIGQTGGLVKLYRGMWTVLSRHDLGMEDYSSISALENDEMGNIWALCSYDVRNGFLIRFNGQSLHTYSIPPPRQDPELWFNYFDIDADYIGNIWVATQVHNRDGGALMKFDGRDWKIYHRFNSGLKDDNIFSVDTDKEGNVWVGNFHGIAKFDGTTWCNFDEGNTDLDMFRVNSIFIDKENIKWFGPSSHGLVRFDDNLWTVYPLITKPENFGGYKAFVDKSGNIWFNSASTLRIYDGNKWTFINLPEQLKNRYYWIDMAFDDTNQLWISNFEKLAHFDGTAWRVFPDSLSPQLNFEPGYICLGGDSTIWISTDGALKEFNYSTNQLLTYRFGQYIDRNQQTPLIYDGKNYWMGTWNNLYKFDGEQFTVYDTNNSELWDNHITCLTVSEDAVLWIGTWQGLNSFDGQNWQRHEELNNVIKEDNYDAKINSIEIGIDGYIWISTPRGIFRYNGQVWTNYNIFNSGLSGNSSENLVIDKNRNLWIGGFDIFREGGVIGNFQTYIDEPYSINISHIPDESLTYHVYPNPFNQSAKIRFDLNKSSQVKIEVYDILGQLVETILDNQRPAGSHTTVFNGSSRASGIYILNIAIDGNYSSKKMVLVK